MSEEQRDAAEASYQKITRAIEENLLPELVRTSETLSNLAKRARASDMRGVILSDAWIDGMAATMRVSHRRINEQSSTIDRLTAERHAVIERWGAMVDIVPDHLRGQEPAEAMRALIAERDAYKAAAKRISDEKQATIDMLYAALNGESELNRLAEERDQAREQLAKLRGMLATLLDAFGTPATRETEVELGMALSGYEAAGMNDEAHVLRTTIRAINAVLGIESEAGE